MKLFWEIVEFIFGNKNDSLPVEIPPQIVMQPITPPGFFWDTKSDAYHSVRVICDQEGLTVEQKNTLAATVWGESDFSTTVVHPNFAFHHDGTKYISSTDYGICQWNDYWHGKEISPTDAVHNPEKAVRLMCAYWKRGQRNQWCANSNGRYKLFLGKVPTS